MNSFSHIKCLVTWQFHCLVGKWNCSYIRFLVKSLIQWIKTSYRKEDIHIIHVLVVNHTVLVKEAQEYNYIVKQKSGKYFCLSFAHLNTEEHFLCLLLLVCLLLFFRHISPTHTSMQMMHVCSFIWIFYCIFSGSAEIQVKVCSWQCQLPCSKDRSTKTEGLKYRNWLKGDFFIYLTRNVYDSIVQ